MIVRAQAGNHHHHDTFSLPLEHSRALSPGEERWRDALCAASLSATDDSDVFAGASALYDLHFDLYNLKSSHPVESSGIVDIYLADRERLLQRVLDLTLMMGQPSIAVAVAMIRTRPLEFLSLSNETLTARLLTIRRVVPRASTAALVALRPQLLISHDELKALAPTMRKLDALMPGVNYQPKLTDNDGASPLWMTFVELLSAERSAVLRERSGEAGNEMENDPS